MFPEKPVTDFLKGNIKNTVRDYFLDKGFYHNIVTIKQIKDSTKKIPHAILVINVEKGKKVRIQDVNIIGNSVIPDWKLRKKLEDSKRRRWYNPFNSGKYLQDNLQKDLPAIATKYNTKGYRDARVIKDTVYFVSKNRVVIDITIDEGNKYYFGKFGVFSMAN